MRRIVPAVLLAVGVLSTAACQPANSVTTSADTASGSAAAGSSAAQAAKVGDAITLKGQTPGEKITVTAVKVVDNAQGADQFTTPDPGKRFVSVQFQIVNSGTVAYDDSPSNGAKAIDSDGQQFDADFTAETTAGPSLPADTKIAPGGKALGFITFQLPTGSTLASVQFSTDSGFGDTGQWTVS